MKKIETIWHHILFEAINHRVFRHTQQDLARQFDYSLSTIHHSLIKPTKIGAIRKESKFFILEDSIKLLYYWASIRNVHKSILYQTRMDVPIREREGLLLPSSIYACYSAASKHLTEPPADYTQLYFYESSEHLKEVEQRFPKNESHEPNVFVFKKEDWMDKYGQITTLPQTFVDIWNLKDWYAKDFTMKLEEKIYGLLS